MEDKDRLINDMTEVLILAAIMGWELKYFIYVCENIIKHYNTLEDSKGPMN